MCLVLAAGLRPGRSRQLGVVALLILALAFLRGAGSATVLAVWTACAAIGWWRLRNGGVWAARLLPALLSALVFGHVFGWSVSPTAYAVPTAARDWYAGILYSLLPLSIYAADMFGLRRRFRLVTNAVIVLALLAPVFVPLPPRAVMVVIAGVYACLATHAWSAAPSLSKRLSSAIFAVTSVGAMLLLVSALALDGRLAADWSVTFMVGVALLSCAGGWAAPMIGGVARWLTARKDQSSHRLAVAFVLGLVLSLSLLWAAYESPPQLSAFAAAGPVLAAQIGGNALVVAAPGQGVEELIAGSGLQALLASPDRARSEREAVMPALDGVINGRLSAIKTIYGADPTLVRQALERYDVSLIVLGPAERAQYGAAAGSALRALLARGELTLAYDDGNIHVLRADTAGGTPAWVVQPVALALPHTAIEFPTPAVQPASEPAASALRDAVPGRDSKLADLEAQVVDEPGNTTAAFGLAQRYLERNRLVDAASVLERAAGTRPQDIAVLHLLGDVLARLDRHDQAIAAWKRAVDEQPTASNLNKLGQGLVEFGRYDEAERVLNEAIARDPTVFDLDFSLGELYRARNAADDRTRALQAYRRYLQRAPSDAPWRPQADEQTRRLSEVERADDRCDRVQ